MAMIVKHPNSTNFIGNSTITTKSNYDQGSMDQELETQLCHRFVRISCEKMLASRQSRGGARLHRNLLILHMLRKVRQDTKILPYECASLLKKSGQSDSSQQIFYPYEQKTEQLVDNSNKIDDNKNNNVKADAETSLNANINGILMNQNSINDEDDDADFVATMEDVNQKIDNHIFCQDSTKTQSEQNIMESNHLFSSSEEYSVKDGKTTKTSSNLLQQAIYTSSPSFYSSLESEEPLEYEVHDYHDREEQQFHFYNTTNIFHRQQQQIFLSTSTSTLSSKSEAAREIHESQFTSKSQSQIWENKNLSSTTTHEQQRKFGRLYERCASASSICQQQIFPQLLPLRQQILNGWGSSNELKNAWTPLMPFSRSNFEDIDHGIEEGTDIAAELPTLTSTNYSDSLDFVVPNLLVEKSKAIKNEDFDEVNYWNDKSTFQQNHWTHSTSDDELLFFDDDLMSAACRKRMAFSRDDDDEIGLEKRPCCDELDDEEDGGNQKSTDEKDVDGDSGVDLTEFGGENFYGNENQKIPIIYNNKSAPRLIPKPRQQQLEPDQTVPVLIRRRWHLDGLANYVR